MKRTIATLTTLAMAAALCGTAWAADGELATYEGQMGHLANSGDEHSELSDDDLIYTTELYVDADGINEQYSNEELVNAESYDSDGITGLDMEESTVGLNALIIYNHDYAVKDANIVLDTASDGIGINDFTGRGSAIAVYGDSNVTIDDSYIETTGVGVMPVFEDNSYDADGNALSPVVTIRNTTMISNGGTIYADYENQFGADLMVAPPWVLGIMGTSRCTNLEGEYGTMNVIDCDTQSGAWAVLSTDMPTGVYLNVVNTTVTLNNADESAAAPIQEDGGQIVTVDNPYTVNYGTGYGTYVNGGTDMQITFLGCDINVGTYAAIFTGGNVTLGSLTPGEAVTLEAATGNAEDAVEYTYEGEEVKNTVINSDTFGFMFHEQLNTLTSLPGTVINSGYDTFLVKTGKADVVEEAGAASKTTGNDVTIDGTEINNGGILIQVMDDDDSSTGQQEENFKHFQITHTEQAGFADSNSTTADGREQNFTFTNGEYSGNIYNASGSDRSENDPYAIASPLNVTLGEGAVLNGAAAMTTAIHVTYDGVQEIKANGGAAFENAEDAAAFAEKYQNTEYTISSYFDVGHVANMISPAPGANEINMTLTDDAVWNVTGTSVITSLTVEGDAQVVVADGATLTVGDQVYEAGSVITAE